VIKKMFRKFFCFASAKRNEAVVETLGGIVAHRATVKNQYLNFRQKKLGFCLKGTALCKMKKINSTGTVRFRKQ
jgi:hypothetical protein